MGWLKPKHTLESVARELVEGLENGSIVLGNQPETAPAEVAEPSGPPVHKPGESVEQQPAKRPA